MSAIIGQSELKAEVGSSNHLTVRDLLLLRIAVGGATRADLQRDVASLLAPRVSGAEFRRSAELALSTLAGAQLTSETKGRLTATPRGSEVAGALLPSTRSFPGAWSDVKIALILSAVTASDSPSIRKAIQRAEGVAALVLQHHFGKSTSRVMSPADLRAELAIVALERAFGNKIKTGLSKGAGLPAKPGRLLAGQLFKEPREIASDGKLIVQLACEIAGAREATLTALELALLRTLMVPKDESTLAPPARPQPQRRPTRAPTPKPANDRASTRRKPAIGATSCLSSRHARILSRCARCGTTCRGGLARQPEGVYLFGMEGDSQRAARLGFIRDCVQGNARGSPSFGPARTGDR